MKINLAAKYTHYSNINNGGGSNPIFPQDTPKFGSGDGQKWGKNGEKSIWEEREKVFVLTSCCTLHHCFLHFKQDFSCTMTWL